MTDKWAFCVSRSQSFSFPSNMAHKSNLVELVSSVKTLSTQPESYFQPSKNLPKDTLSSLKALFDFSRQQDPFKENNSCPLTELMVEDFDDEQIWQQIELQNNPVVSDIRRQIKQLKGSTDRVKLLAESTEKKSVDDDDDENDVEFDDSDDDLGDGDDGNLKGRDLMPASSSDDEELDNNNFIKGDTQKTTDITKTQEPHKEKGKQKYKSKGSIVDDKFFKLSEMTEFLDKMDQQFERNQDGKKSKEDDDDNDDDEEDEDEDVDFFRDISSEEDDDDGEGWGNILGNTAKIMGR